MHNPTLQINIIEKFYELQASLLELEKYVCNTDKNLPAWLLPPKLMSHVSYNHRMCASKFFKQLEFLDDQNPKEILIAPGIFACSTLTYTLIHKINKIKEEFKQSILNLKKEKVKTSDPFLVEKFEQILQSKKSDIRINLKKMGLARLHLKQCYRKFPILNSRPKKVSWTWANTRSIKKIDIETARNMLLKHKQDEGIIYQLSKLASLNANEKLAIVQELAPHLRANIVMKEGNADKRFMLKGTVPIFYLDDEGLPLPEYIPPSNKKGKDSARQIRNDIKLDPTPFLPAIRAHKYLSKSNFIDNDNKKENIVKEELLF